MTPRLPGDALCLLLECSKPVRPQCPAPAVSLKLDDDETFGDQEKQLASCCRVVYRQTITQLSASMEAARGGWGGGGGGGRGGASPGL